MFRILVAVFILSVNAVYQISKNSTHCYLGVEDQGTGIKWLDLSKYLSTEHSLDATLFKVDHNCVAPENNPYYCNIYFFQQLQNVPPENNTLYLKVERIYMQFNPCKPITDNNGCGSYACIGLEGKLTKYVNEVEHTLFRIPGLPVAYEGFMDAAKVSKRITSDKKEEIVIDLTLKIKDLIKKENHDKLGELADFGIHSFIVGKDLSNLPQQYGNEKGKVSFGLNNMILSEGTISIFYDFPEVKNELSFTNPISGASKHYILIGLLGLLAFISMIL